MKASIIGTGDSLRGYDLDSIEGYRIGLNFTYRYTELDAIALYDDPRTWFKDAPEEKVHTLRVYGGKWENIGSRFQFEEWKVANINFSLIFAMNLAIHWGYKEIDVYGCDNYVDEYLHFYDTEKIIPSERNRYNVNFPRIERLLEYMKQDIEDYDITFYNSKIEVFNNKEL